MKPILTLEQLSSLTLPQRLAVFVSWLGEQNPDTPYNFGEICGCALFSFGKVISGATLRSAGGNDISFDIDSGHRRVAIMDMLSTENMVLCSCQTFGELHGKLLALHPEFTPPLLPPSLTEEERLDLIERRPLVGLGPNVLINGGAETSTPKPILKSE